MKIHFYLRYSTTFGETISLQLNTGGGATQMPLQYLNQEFWYTAIELPKTRAAYVVAYQYLLHRRDGQSVADWEIRRRIDTAAYQQGEITVIDTWNAAGAYENAFDTQPFKNIFFKQTPPAAAQEKKPASKTGNKAGSKAETFTHEFRIKAPLLKADEVVCLLGSGHGLHDWSRSQPLIMEPENGWWVVRANLGTDTFPIAYKYGVYNAVEQSFVRYEQGDNRTLYFTPTQALNGSVFVLHDGFVRLPNQDFKGAGVAIPVFSLRSEQSFGTGEFSDLHLLTDWAKSVGLKIIQLLPINDTSATGTWTDSYPYAAISAFALHPLYLNVAQVAGKKDAALLRTLSKQQQALNELPVVDYETVLQEKWKAIRQIFAGQKTAFLSDTAYQAYFEQNRHWLVPYAAFCYLKDQYATADFGQWKTHSRYDVAEVEQLAQPDSEAYSELLLHYFVQWHLHRQLKAATDYAHANGIAVKGDIPIGIYRYSCDAWVAPALYNMDKQAGAPPDDFAEKGQNWGFPTYNWEQMKADGFQWWRQRFEQMSYYFDAFRIDHILGFFRIWSIPFDAVEGILGQFIPAIPVREQEFWQAGIGFSYERLCRPYISERVLWETFGDDAMDARAFLNTPDPGSGRKNYTFKPEYDSQRKLEAYFAGQAANAKNERLRDGLYSLLSNVILLDKDEYSPESGLPWEGAFRFGIEKTSSFRHLEADIQQRLQALYVNYFFRRQDDFWQREAMEKLPALKCSTDMLICGEDLGMVPGCVPEVMQSLGILSLEIQRMPKATGSMFFHPKNAPYLSVVTPSTHDMSTVRGWWEEDRELTQRFYSEELGEAGVAPFFCEPWINRAIVEQHFFSPAMWSIFQLQDLMGIDGDLRRPNPAEERINVPAIAKHYWQYRMHLSLENLLKSDALNEALRMLVVNSGRG